MYPHVPLLSSKDTRSSAAAELLVFTFFCTCHQPPATQVVIPFLLAPSSESCCLLQDRASQAVNSATPAVKMKRAQLLSLLLWCQSEVSLALAYNRECTNGGVRCVNGKHFPLSFGKPSCFHQGRVEFDLEESAWPGFEGGKC